MNEAQDDLTPLASGAETSEHALAKSSNWLSTVMLVLGILASIAGAVVEGVSQYMQTMAQTAGESWVAPTWVTMSLVIGGIVLSVIAGVREAVVTGKYVEGRSLIKANAAAAPKAVILPESEVKVVDKE
ncbi:MAG: hypothetical protein HS116_18460 [Planctomycetes bacterium]|nr:hypothetical protein [Planctomycetota bacterium]